MEIDTGCCCGELDQSNHCLKQRMKTSDVCSDKRPVSSLSIGIREAAKSLGSQKNRVTKARSCYGCGVEVPGIDTLIRSCIIQTVMMQCFAVPHDRLENLRHRGVVQ